MLLMELSTLDLDDIQLPINLNLIQHPVSSSESPSFFFLPFDFPTSQDSFFNASPPNPMFYKTQNPSPPPSTWKNLYQITLHFQYYFLQPQESPKITQIISEISQM